MLTSRILRMTRTGDADAERILLSYPNHDYMYIQSPAGAQYARNCFRNTWERI